MDRSDRIALFIIWSIWVGREDKTFVGSCEMSPEVLSPFTHGVVGVASKTCTVFCGVLIQ